MHKHKRKDAVTLANQAMYICAHAAYFGSTAFDRFVHDGSIRVGQVLEIRTYKIGMHGGDRGHPFVGLVWIYPVPLVVAVAGLDGGGGAVNDRADTVNDNINGVAAADGVDGQDRATTINNNDLQAVDPPLEPEAPVHGGRCSLEGRLW